MIFCLPAGLPSLPVCVKSFGDASSGDAESWFRVSVCESGEGRDSLHFPPAQLLQSVRAPFQQGRRDQVPQRSASRDTCLLSRHDWKMQKGRNKAMALQAYLPLQLLVISLVGVAAGEDDSSGEAAGFDPGHEQLTKLFGLWLQFKQR